MQPNIAVVNNSGNVGKSTICETLLQPRLKNSEIIKVETINSDGSDDVKFSAKEYDQILKKIDLSECAIIDVGSSNIEGFVLKMSEYKDSHEDIDFFIIPTIPQHKQQVDAASTASNLLSMGIEQDRIKFIFNQVDKSMDLKRQFNVLLEELNVLDFKLNNYPIIYDTSVFSELNKSETTFNDVVNDNRDFRTLLRQAETQAEKETLSDERTIKRLVSGVNDVLDVAFENLGII
ncbi:StbB family protein [Photobacterium indicum]|uniref:StbB family protein n=1 Tax=Photobacterium indicum TaxID=81447 RepID=UPI003D0EAD05